MPDDVRERCREEWAQLAERIKLLRDFTQGDRFALLVAPAQDRLLRQYVVMREYLEVLGERIEHD